MNYELQIIAFLKKYVPRIDTLIFILFFMVLIPLIAISFFVHPRLDDYCYAVKVERFGFWEAQIKWYNAWTVIENNISLFIQYMISRKKQKYLVPKSQIMFLKDLGSNTNVFFLVLSVHFIC